jgi:malonate transporter and related proteins
VLDQTIGPIVPVAFVIALGFWAGRRGTLSQADSLLISRLVLTWILPALLLVGMAGTPRSQLLDVRFVGATFVGLVGMYVFAFAIGWYRYRRLKEASLKGLACGYPDAAFMGIPILESMFGSGSLYSVLVLNVIASLILMPLTNTLLTMGDNKGSGARAFVSSVLASVRRPILWAPAIGILCSALAVELPPALAGSLNLLGKATPGVSLLCLGLIMASARLRLSREVWGNTALKLLVHPALMIGAALLLSVGGIQVQQMILLCALPSATISGMFANEAGAYRDEAATSILVSTVLSVLTFPLVAHLVGQAPGAT